MCEYEFLKENQVFKKVCNLKNLITALREIESHNAKVATSLSEKLKSEQHTQRIKDIISEVRFAWGCSKNKISLVYEPHITVDGELDLFKEGAPHKKSDFAVKLDNRWISIEIKTITRHDEKDPHRFGPLEREVEERLRSMSQRRKLPYSVIADFESCVLEYKEIFGKVAKQVAKQVEVELDRIKVIDLSKPIQFDLIFNDERIGKGVILPRGKKIVKGHSIGLKPFKIEPIIDRGQLVSNLPNIIILDSLQDLIPTPDMIINDLYGTYSKGFFNRSSSRLISAVLHLDAQGRTTLSENPNSDPTMKLTEKEKQTLISIYDIQK